MRLPEQARARANAAGGCRSPATVERPRLLRVSSLVRVVLDSGLLVRLLEILRRAGALDTEELIVLRIVALRAACAEQRGDPSADRKIMGKTREQGRRILPPIAFSRAQTFLDGPPRPNMAKRHTLRASGPGGTSLGAATRPFTLRSKARSWQPWRLGGDWRERSAVRAVRRPPSRDFPLRLAFPGRAPAEPDARQPGKREAGKRKQRSRRARGAPEGAGGETAIRREEPPSSDAFAAEKGAEMAENNGSVWGNIALVGRVNTGVRRGAFSAASHRRGVSLAAGGGSASSRSHCFSIPKLCKRRLTPNSLLFRRISASSG